MTKKIRIFLLSLIVIYFLFGLLLFVSQKSLIYFPDKSKFEDCSHFTESEKITHNSFRGYLSKKSNENLVIFYHGNAGRACDRYFLKETLSAKGYSTLFVEYTGYAESQSNPSKDKILGNVEDLKDYLKSKQYKNVVVVSESIGTGPATYHSFISPEISKLILITPYNSLAEVAYYHYPIYPMSLLFTENFIPAEWLKSYDGSVSLICAENDEIMINDVCSKLFDSITSTNKSKFIVRNATHNSIYESKDFIDALIDSL